MRGDENGKDIDDVSICKLIAEISTKTGSFEGPERLLQIEM